MEAKKLTVKAYSHVNKTTLDRAYSKHIKKISETLTSEGKLRWETYEMIFQELFNEGKTECLNEIKYRLTDGEDPNEVILDVIEKYVDDVNALIWFFKRRIEEYKEEDFFKHFSE
jgi:hypothetical protein